MSRFTARSERGTHLTQVDTPRDGIGFMLKLYTINPLYNTLGVVDVEHPERHVEISTLSLPTQLPQDFHQQITDWLLNTNHPNYSPYDRQAMYDAAMNLLVALIDLRPDLATNEAKLWLEMHRRRYLNR